MGERFQFYVISKDNHITAIHDQWVWGVAALKYTNHLVNILKHTDFENSMCEEMDEYIASILRVRWHTESNEHFYHRVHIEDMNYSPNRADTNYGCVIIDARNTKKVKIGFYDEKGKYMKYIDWVQHCHKNETDYNKAEILKMIKETLPSDEDYDKLDQDFYAWLCAEMARRAQKQEFDSMRIKLRDNEKIDEGKKLLAKFEEATDWAEIRALSKLSLEQPLDDKQYERFMELGKKLGLQE